MYYLLQYGILIAISSYLVLNYAASHVSWHIKIWSIFTWVLNFSLALLVPEDVYITILDPPQDSPKGIQKIVISYQYLLLYWLVYALTWTIIPVLQEWENSGDLKSIDRLKRSLRVNGIFYLYMLIGGVIVLMLLWYFKVGQEMGLMIWLKCLATVWGIFLQIVMMGYAIVEIPRSLWLQANYEKYLKYCYIKIEDLEESRNSAIFEYKELTSKILIIKDKQFPNVSNTELQNIRLYCESSLSLAPKSLIEKMPSNLEGFLKTLFHTDDIYKCLGIPDPSSNPDLSENLIQNSQSTQFGQTIVEMLIQFHRQTKRILARYRRLTIELDQFYRQAILYEDILLSQRAQQFQISSPLIQKQKMLFNLWIFRLKPFIYKAVAILLTIFSIIILISQTQIFLSSSPSSASLLGWIIKIQNIQVIRVLVFITIAYISYMVYYSLFRLKLFNLYGLYKHHSDGPSLMFATINFSRVGVAIVLNFFDMIKLTGIYTQVMGTVKMGLIGQWVIKGLPGVLWLIVLCHYMNFWGKFIEYFKISSQLNFWSHHVDDNALFQEEQGDQENSKLWVRSQVKRYRRQLNKNPEFQIYSQAVL